MHTGSNKPVSDERRIAEIEDPRVRFAAERTLLAWLRTGLALMGLGFVVARFGLFLRELAAAHQTPTSSHGWSLAVGTGLVAIGIVIMLCASLEHWYILRRLNRHEPYAAPRYSLGLAVAITLALAGAGMIAYLLLVGI